MTETEFLLGLRSERERRLWLGAMFDAEGTVGVSVANRLQIGFGMKCVEPIRAIMEIYPGGSYCEDQNGFFRLFYYNAVAKGFLEVTLPFLLEKRDLAQIIVDYYPVASGSGTRRSQNQIEIAKRIRIIAKAFNDQKSNVEPAWLAAEVQNIESLNS